MVVLGGGVVSYQRGNPGYVNTEWRLSLSNEETPVSGVSTVCFDTEWRLFRSDEEKNVSGVSIGVPCS